MEDHTSTPGTIFPFGLVMIDEPANVGVSTFANNGEVLLTVNCRNGGDCGQVIIGLSAHQTLQLIERLQVHADICGRAIVDGKGGAQFPIASPPDRT
jgi:hypothetical protein